MPTDNRKADQSRPAGSIWKRAVILEGRTVGQIWVDVEQLAEAFREYARRELGWLPDPTRSDVERWLAMDNGAWIGRRTAINLVEALNLGERAARATAPRIPLNAAEPGRMDEVAAAARARRRLDVNAARWRFDAALAQPCSRFLPASVCALLPTPADSQAYSLGAFVALAWATQNAAALRGFEQWLHADTTQRQGRRKADWRTILESYELTRAALRIVLPEIRRARNRSIAWRAQRCRALFERFDRVGLADDISAPKALQAGALAAALVAREHGVAASSVTRRWKNRAQY